MSNTEIKAPVRPHYLKHLSVAIGVLLLGACTTTEIIPVSYTHLTLPTTPYV